MEKLKYDEFSITAYDSEQSDYMESIFYHGNGYMGSRGYACEDISIRPHQKGIYMAGIFDFLKDGITDVVNTPDFLKLDLSFGSPGSDHKPCRITDFSQSLRLSDGVFDRDYLLHDGERTLHVKISRFFSLFDVHVAAIRLEATPVNFTGLISCASSIDTSSCNLPVNDDQVKKNTEYQRYIRILSKTPTEAGGLLELETLSTRIKITEAFAVQYSRKTGAPAGLFCNDSNGISKIDTFNVQSGEPFRMDKFISVFTSRDTDGSQLKERALEKVRECCEKGYDRLLAENAAAWSSRWETADIVIKGDRKAQTAIRYNIFQLVSNQSKDDASVSIGARGLTHPRYKGCYFWDTEIFMLPFFIYTHPIAAKNLLKYRFNSLEAARVHAAKMNSDGARFPWMASFDGSEQCESWDTGACEIHITCDIAFALDHYVRVTGDTDFLNNYAAELFIETARFWASRYTYNQEADRYHLLFTKGPDEYCGVSHNNTYTIYLSLYNIRLAINAIEAMRKESPSSFDALHRKTGFDECELQKWNDILEKTPINYDEARKLFIQDDTFMLLEPLEISRYKTDNTPLYHQICFDRLQRFRVLKQADIILLMTLFPNHFSKEQKKAAWDFYEPLTLHDSTLSFGTHALLGAQIKENKAVDYLKKSLFLDLDNIMNNTGNEGLHIAALGATWQAVVFGFAGLSFDDGSIRVDPYLPDGWEQLVFTLMIQGRKVKFIIGRDSWTMEDLD